MASTYSNIKIQLMATGENSGTWGNVTNVNLGTAIEQAMVETATVTFASANVTLTLTDTNAAQNARALRLNLTGTTGGARDLIVPAIQKPYIVNNGTADTITVKVSGQTGIAVPASKTMLVYNNGTDVVDAINHLSALSLGTALPIASGGTGSTSTTYANLESNVTGTLPVANGGTSATTLTAESVVVGNGTSAVKFVAPGTDGNVLTSNGTAWVSEAPVVPQGVPTGSVMAFAGDPGSGWLEANGQIVSQSTYSDLYAKVGLLADGFKTSTAYIQAPANDVAIRARCVAYGNSTYVVGGFNSAVGGLRAWTSTDAVTWTPRSITFPVSTVNDMTDLVYGDKFVGSFIVSGTAATNRNQIATSTDGITWTVRTTTDGTNSGISLVYTGSTYVLAMNANNSLNCIQTSTDGITWAIRTTAVATVAPQLAYGNGTIIAFGGQGSTNWPTVQTSTDGITWTYRSVVWPISNYQGGAWYANDRFYVGSTHGNIAQGGELASSTDGITWSLVTTVSKYGFLPTAVTYDSTSSLLFVWCRSVNYIPQSGPVLISADNGVTWQQSDYGIFYQGTSTNSPTPFSGNYGAPRSQGSRGFNAVNGKIIMVGSATYTEDNNNEDQGAIILAADPYTYQTDTQFCLPWTLNKMINGMGHNSVAGIKYSSVTDGPAGKDLKHYIKT
jgi:hypothetical protein